MYARGILFGKMKYELGDHSYIRCPETGMEADIEFKTKGYFGGTYNAIGGFIKDKSGKQLFELSGLWNEEMWLKDLTVRQSTFGWSDWGRDSADFHRRLAKNSFSSMHRTPNHRTLWLGPWKNKTSGNRKSCGIW